MDNSQKMTGTITKDGDEAIEGARGIAQTAWEKGRETWNDLSDQGKEALAGAQKKAEESWGDAQALVQKHPGKSVGIAFVVGAAIGALLAFRRDD